MSVCTDKQRAWICDAVVTSAVGVDPNHAERVFIRVMEDFLVRSGSWIEEVWFPITNEGKLTLDYTPRGGQFSWLMRVTRKDGRPLVHSSVDPGQFRTPVADLPVYYSNTPYPDVLQIFPVPVDIAGLKLLARSALQLDNCEPPDEQYIPDWLFARYREGLRRGTLESILMEGNKPYTNTVLSKAHGRVYQQFVSRSRDEARRGFGMHESEWRFPQSFQA